MTEERLRAVILEAAEPEDCEVDTEVERFRRAAHEAPTVLIDAAIDHLPDADHLVVAPDCLVAVTHPRGQGPLRALPAVVSYAPDHIRIEVEWDGTRYVAPFTWDHLASAPLMTGWEVRQRSSMTPDIESSTPYMVFTAEDYGILIAIHPAAIRVLAQGLALLVGAR